jgi:DNA-binding beta-propeller fold protein YncE
MLGKLLYNIFNKIIYHNLEFLLKISYSFAILSFIIIVGNNEKLNINIVYGEEYTFSKTWGSTGTEDGQFIFPHSLAIDIYGNIYVTDTGNNRLQKFSSVGSFITKWGEEGSADGQFSQLHDIAVHPNGKFIYTVELNNHRYDVTRYITFIFNKFNLIISSLSKPLFPK